jgi:hypothetical protein
MNPVTNNPGTDDARRAAEIERLRLLVARWPGAPGAPENILGYVSNKAALADLEGGRLQYNPLYRRWE